MLAKTILCLLLAGTTTIAAHAADALSAGPTAGAADPRKLCLVLTGEWSAQPGELVLRDASGPALKFSRVGGQSIASIDVSELQADGTLILHRRAAGPATATASAGVYLLPGWPEAQLQNRTTGWLRQAALAAREFRASSVPERIVLDRFVPLDFDIVDGRLRRLGVLDSNLVAEGAGESLVWCGDRPAVYEQQSLPGDQRVAVRYRDPTETRNEIGLDVEKRADRVVVRMSYVVNQPIDRDVPVHFRVPLAKPLTSLFGVAWRFTRSRRGGTGELAFDPEKPSQSIHTFMSQAPIALARMVDGSQLSVIDYDLSNLVVEAKRAPGAPDALLVSTYLWPREKGRRYEWTFEVLGGYENLYNAALRATWPFTRDNALLYRGVLAREVYNEFPALDEPLEKGVRAIWYHRWFRRNGDYFNPAWPMDKPYKTAFPYHYTYETVRENVVRLKAHGFQVFMYIQFAGISADVQPVFDAWMVRDQEGKIIRAGQDGRLFNLWVNPDPAGAYGRSVLDQIAAMFDAIPADGIALDRIDRMDWTYGPDQFDYGHFNGYSSVFPPRRPVASITVAGKAWLDELRKLLDARGKKLVINSSAHMYAINVADSNMMEVTDNPICLLLGKVFANGKSVSYTCHGRMNDAMNNFLAELAQGYPYHRDRLQAGFKFDGIEAPRNFAADRDRGRLLYAISEDGRWPTLWYFDNGHSRLKYNPREQNIELRFRGSGFVPRDSGSGALTTRN